MENLLEIILFIISSLLSATAGSYIVYALSCIISKLTYNKKNLLYGALIILPFCIFNNFIPIYMPNIKFIMPMIGTIACTIILLRTYKYKKISKILLILVLYSIVTFIMDILLAVILILLNKDIAALSTTPKLQYIMVGVTNILNIVAMKALLLIYSKKNVKLILKENNKYIVFQSITIIICLIPSMYLLFSNYYQYSIGFVLINALQLIIVSIFSIVYLRKGIQFKDTKLELENTKLHNQALAKINESIRGLKHDMGNMVQAINGYISVGNIEGVKDYCKNMVHSFNDVNILSILSPKVIDDPAIYGVVVGKMLEARDKDLTLSLDVNLNVSSINFPSFELSRIIGILLDNAMEAALESESKKLTLDMHYDNKRNADIIIIGNSVKNPDKIDIIKMFEKDYSTKKNPSGFGLYEVLKFFKKNNKGDIVPNIDYDKDFFTQTLTFDRY